VLQEPVPRLPKIFRLCQHQVRIRSGIEAMDRPAQVHEAALKPPAGLAFMTTRERDHDFDGVAHAAGEVGDRPGGGLSGACVLGRRTRPSQVAHGQRSARADQGQPVRRVDQTEAVGVPEPLGDGLQCLTGPPGCHQGLRTVGL
jgi:hypothetical protein